MSEQKLIAESRTFEQQMIERDKRATKAGFVVGGVGLLIAVLALVAVVVMLPLKQTDVELYTVDNHTGRVEHVTRTSKTSLTAEEAYQKAMAANYVKVRERYVYPSLQDDYETVQVYNSPQVNDDY
ncbi:VirB8/TrbF family protein, partial [Salmonella enterica]